MSAFFRQTGAILGRDLSVAGRAGETLSVILPFAAVAVFVVPLATDPLTTDLSELAAPVFWLAALLFGMQVALRQSGNETVTQRRHLALAGLDPVARFAGRSGAAAILILAMLAVIGPLVVVFYSPAVVPPLAPAGRTVGLFVIGLAMLTTLAGDITTGLRARSVLAPLLVAPLAVPLVIGGAQSLRALTQGGSTLTWTLVLVVADLALAVTGVVTARLLEEAAL